MDLPIGTLSGVSPLGDVLLAYGSVQEAEPGVDVTCAELGATAIEFAVRDTGRGIPPHAMATLYEPFRRRQHPGEYTFSGSGLGLSICRKLVEAMGAPLEVDTELGIGTRFHFVLDLPLAGQP